MTVGRDKGFSAAARCLGPRQSPALKSIVAALLVALGSGGCGSDDDPTASAALTPEQVRGIWTFVRTGPSPCVPDTVAVRLTTAFYTIGAPDTLAVSGDWTSNRDTRVRVFTGVVARAGGFLLRLTLNEGIQGSMDARGNAKASAFCADGSAAPMTGVRSF